jgi:hypothetical protein
MTKTGMRAKRRTLDVVLMTRLQFLFIAAHQPLLQPI